MLTDNEILVNAAIRNYDRFKVPTNFIDSEKRVRYYTPADKADLDMRTSVNKIGEIVNLSQQLNSLYWQRRHDGESYEDCEELYNDVCKLAALSNIEIDRAKREYTIDSGKEINILKKKYQFEQDGKTVKPMFFKTITIENGYELSENIEYRWFETPMDYLQRIISKESRKQARECKNAMKPFMSIVRSPKDDTKSGYYKTIKNEVIKNVRHYKALISRCYIGYDSQDSENKERVKEDVDYLKEECMSLIDSMCSHRYLMYLVLKDLEDKNNRDIKSLMFDTLFGKPNESFMCMIEESKDPVGLLVEDPEGEEKYYDFTYSREVH